MLAAPKISVIVPVYNAADFLNKCLNSILSQTVTDFEILLINDGSTDQSGRICEHYAAVTSKIKVFHQKNGGVSAARNKGIAASCGRYIVFIDADDYVEAHFLEAFFYLDANPTNALVQQGFVREYQDGTMRKTTFSNKVYLQGEFSALFVEMKLIRRLPFICSKLFDAEVIRKHHIRFNTAITYGEDLVFLLDCFLHLEKFMLIDQSPYHYLRVEGSSTYNSHSYESGLQRFNTVKAQLETLFHHFQLAPAVRKYNNSYIPNYLVKALKSLYSSPHKKSRKERINILKKHAQSADLQLIKNDYVPLTLSNKYFKILFSPHSMLLCDVYLNLSLRYRQVKQQSTAFFKKQET